MTPANEVSGNCGVSWIYEVAHGGVIAIAVSFEWKYWMGDQGGVTSHTHSGPLSSTDWHTPPDYWSHLTAGSASSWVDTSGHAWAILNDGRVCVGGNASDHTTIF